MNNEDFKRRLAIDLNTLNYIQRSRFSWLCGVRALPFLGGWGHFDFWADSSRQQYIYAIFRALDSGFSVAQAARPSAYAIADAAVADAAVAVIAKAAVKAANAAFANAAYATAATATSANAAYANANANANAAAIAATAIATATTTATMATSVDAADAAVAAAVQSGMDLRPCILSDLTRIKSPNKEQMYYRSDWYGEIWDNFQAALQKEDCAYWGHVYQRIFDDGLIMDLDALKRRLSIPNEITQNGAAAVANYLEELEKGATRLNEARVIILGEKGAGKTCIARKLVDPDALMTTDDESTAGVDTTLWKLEEDNVNVRIWDFAGHTVTHAVHQFFLSERCLYLLVYDGRTEDRNRLVYWLDHMKNYGGNSSAIILVNKRDCHSVDIPINFLEEKYSIAGVYAFSIKDDANELLGFRNEIIGHIKNNPSWEKELIPTHYFKVKEELEKRFVKDEEECCQEHITKGEFNEIAKRCGVEDTEKLLGALHSLGVSLWYQDMESFNTLILNPEWISHGVYKIINWADKEQRYSINIQDFETVFADEEDRVRYPQDKYKFFFELMVRFELAYKVKDEEKLIIPHLLKEDRPKKLPNFPVGDGLMLRYSAEQPLPPHTISRFIVRHNREIKKEGENYLVWRHGVVLEIENTTALVREVDRTISVSVKGPDKTNYISALRETLNDIFNSYKSDAPELQYRVERHGQIPDEVEEQYPLWVVDRKVANLYKRGKPLYDDITGQDIPMTPTVTNYNIQANNVALGHGELPPK